MWEELSALTQAFLVASLRANTSWTNGSGRELARHLDRRPIADDHLDLGPFAAVEHVGDQGRSAERVARDRRPQKPHLTEITVGVLAHPVEAAQERKPHLPSVRLLRWNEAGLIAQAVDREDVETVRGAVATVGGGHPAVIERPAPPRARQRGQDVLMKRRRPLPSVRGVEIMVLGRMGVAGEADHETAPFEQREEGLPVLQVLIRLIVEKGADRNVHHDDDQRVVGRMREHIADERELPLVDACPRTCPRRAASPGQGRDSSRRPA